jgi:hypothetical protein
LFFIDNSDTVLAKIVSVQFTFKRGDTILAQGNTPGNLWNKEFKEHIKTIKKGDSVILDNVEAKVQIIDSSYNLKSRNNIHIGDVRIEFAYDYVSQNKEDLAFVKRIMSLKGFEKLLDIYASDVSIDKSFTNVDIVIKKVKGTFTKRYQFLSSGSIDYDFTFTEDKKGQLRIYDNRNKTKYNVAQWEKQILVLLSR